jgi:hypothetical protein
LAGAPAVALTFTRVVGLPPPARGLMSGGTFVELEAASQPGEPLDRALEEWVAVGRCRHERFGGDLVASCLRMGGVR